MFVILLFVIGYFAWNALPTGSDTQEIAKLIRFGLSATAFVGTMIFYIRWCDNWFRQHADEEFLLKRLLLDIDRASWIVEMSLEWAEEKGTEIPEELIDRLSNNLFSGKNDISQPTHPSETFETTTARYRPGQLDR